ncbi:MAG: divalent-cation tolerance protein CutA [Balneolaceae bacterium]
MFNNLRLVYITTKDKQEARAIGAAVVKEKLAACVNIIDGMESMYWWEGEIQTDSECVLLVKTTHQNMRSLTERVKELHSYDVPCVISLTLTEQEGNPEYIDWLLSCVKRLDTKYPGSDE